MSCTECASDAHLPRDYTACLCYGQQPADYDCYMSGNSVVAYTIGGGSLGNSACVQEGKACDVWQWDRGFCKEGTGLVVTENEINSGELRRMTPKETCIILAGKVEQIWGKEDNCIVPTLSKEGKKVGTSCSLTSLYDGTCF